MTTTHKISHDFYVNAYTLFALHSSLEDYAVVYALNKYLKSKLFRSKADLDISVDLSFPIFEWKDMANDCVWTLINNSCRRELQIENEGLFQNELAVTTHYLVPEYKDVDYFLKIEGDTLSDEQDLLNTINTIPRIITAYAIAPETLKSKENLIF